MKGPEQIPCLNDKDWVIKKRHPYQAVICYQFENKSIVGMFRLGILFATGISEGHQCFGEFYENLTDADKARISNILPDLFELWRCSSHQGCR